MGLAVMNRLGRAASFHTLEAEKVLRDITRGSDTITEEREAT